jgi:hypothetical protein
VETECQGVLVLDKKVKKKSENENTSAIKHVNGIRSALISGNYRTSENQAISKF